MSQVPVAMPQPATGAPCVMWGGSATDGRVPLPRLLSGQARRSAAALPRFRVHAARRGDAGRAG